MNEAQKHLSKLSKWLGQLQTAPAVKRRKLQAKVDRITEKMKAKGWITLKENAHEKNITADDGGDGKGDGYIEHASISD